MKMISFDGIGSTDRPIEIKPQNKTERTTSDAVPVVDSGETDKTATKQKASQKWNELDSAELEEPDKKSDKKADEWNQHPDVTFTATSKDLETLKRHGADKNKNNPNGSAQFVEGKAGAVQIQGENLACPDAIKITDDTNGKKNTYVYRRISKNSKAESSPASVEVKSSVSTPTTNTDSPAQKPSAIRTTDNSSKRTYVYQYSPIINIANSYEEGNYIHDFITGNNRNHSKSENIIDSNGGNSGNGNENLINPFAGYNYTSYVTPQQQPVPQAEQPERPKTSKANTKPAEQKPQEKVEAKAEVQPMPETPEDEEYLYVLESVIDENGQDIMAKDHKEVYKLNANVNTEEGMASYDLVQENGMEGSNQSSIDYSKRGKNA